jgi:2-polyprenyl-6-methoxyphenol hydroxylase-like FAD-dependent oxidoreductase
MRVGVVGGGPAGLFYAYLLKRGDPRHQVRVIERNPEGATYGWGVVFSDVALAFVREVAPELHASMTERQEVHDDMAIVHRGVHVRLAHNVFHRMARLDLLNALQSHARRVGVEIEFGRRVDDIDALRDAELIVAADGAHSTIRTRHAARFGPELDVRPNWFAWYGTRHTFDPLSLVFRQTDEGLFIAHAYRYSRTHSTFLVECDPVTFERARLASRTEAESLALCERVFADDLQGAPLLSNRSSWFRYTIIKNRHWAWNQVVLLGDALRTGHPSIGSGTRLALQDAIALHEASRAHDGDVPAILAEFERIRRPGSDALQAAAIRSTEWYENLGPKMALDPVSFAYDYLVRNGRVTHAQVRERDPELAAAYERLHPELRA